MRAIQLTDFGTDQSPIMIGHVYGEGRTAPEAEAECHNAALDYVRKWPDTGPLTDWVFRPVPPDLVA
jgi:hypothetical protein